MDVAEFITKKIKIHSKCPECKKRKLVEVHSTSIDAFYDEKGNIKDTVWFFLNIDIVCKNKKCKYRRCLASDNAGSESIKEIMKSKYKDTNTGIMLRRALANEA
jgi:hypothetical protein